MKEMKKMVVMMVFLMILGAGIGVGVATAGETDFTIEYGNEYGNKSVIQFDDEVTPFISNGKVYVASHFFELFSLEEKINTAEGTVTINGYNGSNNGSQVTWTIGQDGVIMQNERMMIPLRSTLEAIGLNDSLSWDSNRRAVMLNTVLQADFEMWETNFVLVNASEMQVETELGEEFQIVE